MRSGTILHQLDQLQYRDTGRGGGGAIPLLFLADQLTPFQPVGQNVPTTLLLASFAV